MCDLYDQDSAEAIRTRLLLALGVACVCRGDELRDLMWAQLYWQLSQIIGEQLHLLRCSAAVPAAITADCFFMMPCFLMFNVQ
jgi:hypothetical protein